MGGPLGYLGFPITDESGAGSGRYSRFQFQGSSIMWHPVYGVRVVQGRVGEVYWSGGGPSGPWGFAVTDEYPDGPSGRSSDFEIGTLAWTPDNDVLDVLHGGAPGSVTPAAGNWSAVSRSGRMGYVMRQLVYRFGFPANGAAGLVGNLFAESGVIPSRIEGSAEATPMRAANFSGIVTDFTADQIMTQQSPGGPFKPGVGLAQWTDPARRNGMFSHFYFARFFGSDTLFSMDIQLDYLVRELRTSFSGVYATLTKTSVSVDDASDDVVYRFEIPKDILLSPTQKRPRADPAVQAVFGVRRTASHQALGTL